MDQSGDKTELGQLEVRSLLIVLGKEQTKSGQIKKLTGMNSHVFVIWDVV